MVLAKFIFVSLLLFQEGPSVETAKKGKPDRPPEWYEVVTGIMAIPLTLVGGVYSWALIRKTNLEARRTELEIQEKERDHDRPIADGAPRVVVPATFRERRFV